MKTHNKTPESKHVIRFQDCDPFGHLNNSKYIDYMINAREDHLIRYYDLNVFQMANREKKAWVVGQNEIAYLKPALVMEPVVIETRLIRYNERFVQPEMIMYNQDKSQVKAVLWSRFFYFDFAEGRAITHGEELMNLFETLNMPLSVDRVEDRARMLSSELKKGVLV